MKVLTHRWSPALATGLLAALFVPTSALAQSPNQQAPQQKAADQPAPRYQTTFEPAGRNQKVRMWVAPTVVDDQWQVQVADASSAADTDSAKSLGPGKSLGKVPDWITADHYGFEVVSEPLGDKQTAVILAALPGVQGEAPPSATQFQVVWIVEPRRGSLHWRRLDTAQYSTLDGGERFEFRDHGKYKRLIRRRRGHDSIFCGASAKEPVLFDAYRPKTGRFTQELDIQQLVADAPTVKAHASDADFTPPRLQAFYQWFAASSDRRSPNRRGALIRPLELGDHTVDTAWLEGVDGLGRGEFVSAQINDAVELSSVRLVPGLGGSKAQYQAFARPTRLLVGLSNGSRYIVDIGKISFDEVSSGRGVMIDLPEPQKTRCISVMLLDAEKGGRVDGQPGWARETVAVAEITPYSVLHGADADQTARRVVERIAAEKDPRRRQRIAELALTLKDNLVTEVRRAVREGSPQQRRRIIPLMASLPAKEAVPMLVDFLRQTDPSAAEYRAVKRSLAAHYADAAPGLVAYLSEGSLDDPRKHTDVLRLLGRVAEPDDLTALIDDLGEGPDMVRNERIRAIGAGGAPLVEPLVVFARAKVNTDAGYDALRTLDLLGKRLHYNDQGDLPRAELFRELLAQGNKRRGLMRALRVAKFFRTDGFVDLVRERFVAHDDPLVRQAAIAALARYPSATARTTIVAALEDPSPDVRIAAISALGERDDAGKVIAEVIDYSKKERWRPGLRQAFRVLASIDTETTTAAFHRRFKQDPNTPASLLAAQALDRASRTIDAELARSLVEDSEVNMEMRIEMLDLLGLDNSPEGESFLLGLMTDQGWKKLADSTRQQRQLRDHIFMSVGRRRSTKAREQLLDAARHADSVAVQKIALRALAFFEDQALLEALREWRDSADPRLHGSIDQTITMIDRRLSLTSVREDISKVLDEDENSETKDASNASE